MPRARRTRHHARRLAVDLLERLVVDAVHAQRALLHRAALDAVLARAVRARPRTQLAADALVRIDQHDAVLRALVACPGRAHGHAGRRLAVQARAREMHGLRWRAGNGECGIGNGRSRWPDAWRMAGFSHSRFPTPDSRLHRIRMHPVEPHPMRLGAVGIGIGQGAEVAAVVPFLARDRAGVAADAGVEVDHEAELSRRWRWQRGHPCMSAPPSRLDDLQAAARDRARSARAGRTRRPVR